MRISYGRVQGSGYNTRTGNNVPVCPGGKKKKKKKKSFVIKKLQIITFSYQKVTDLYSFQQKKGLQIDTFLPTS